MTDPKDRQISDSLRLEIESGDLPPDSQLPTETDLSKEFGASRNTIRDAIKSLISLGLVENLARAGHLCHQTSRSTDHYLVG
jgi:DNA-binding GntR family transcriptional regulator